MSDQKKSWGVVFVIIIAVVIVAGYFFYQNIIRKTIPGIQAVPRNSVVVLDIPNTYDFIQNLTEENDLWTALSKAGAIQDAGRQLILLDSIGKENSNYQTTLSGRSYICLLAVNDSLQSLIIFQPPEYKDQAHYKNIMSKIYGSDLTFKNTRHQGDELVQANLKKDGKRLFFTTSNGLFICSEYPGLVYESLLQLENDDPLTGDPAFSKVEKTSGKNVDAHVYVNDKKVGDLLSILGKKNTRETIELLNNFSGWTELDVIFKNDELLLNGYTAGSDSIENYLQTFGKQTPQKIDITSILPFNTNVLINFGFQDFNSYYNHYENFLRASGKYDPYYNEIVKINNKYRINLEKAFLSWIGSEIGLISLAGTPADFDEKSYVVLNTKDPVAANQLLTDVMHKVPGSRLISNFKGQLIKRINLEKVYSTLLGPVFSPLRNPYYTIIGDYVVFANSSNALESFINTHLSGKTLASNINFKDFSDNISDRSNLLLYFNTRNALELADKFADPEIAGIIRKHRNDFINFHAFALQFSSLNQMFYTNLYLKYNPGYREENRAVWKTELDAPIFGKPFLVRDHTDRTYNIIAFDEDKQMYLIDNNGNILWKMAFAGNLMGEVYPVDYFKNRKVQYLFNTDEYIYLIDLLGRKVANYPIKLGTRASNGLALFDYVGNKDYRIVFAGDNNKVFNYNLKGNAIRGWKTPNVGSEVKNTIQHLVASNKDYIIIPKENGGVEITDRRGKTRIKIKGDFQNALNSDFYVNKTNSKGIIITTDINGHLTYIKTNGRLDRTIFGDYSPMHYFLYEDLDKNGGKDFIFLDNNKLIVFDRFKNVMFEYEFDFPIRQKPEIIRVSNRENLLGIVSSDDNKLFLFDGKGNIVFNTGLVGSTRFAVGSLNNDKDLNLVVGTGSTLYNYLIK